MKRLLSLALLAVALPVMASAQVVHDPALQASLTTQNATAHATQMAQYAKDIVIAQSALQALQNLKNAGGNPAAVGSAIAQSANLLNQAKAMRCPTTTVSTATGHPATGMSPGVAAPAPAVNPCLASSQVAEQQIGLLSNTLTGLSAIASMSAGGIAGPTAAMQLATQAIQQETVISTQILQMQHAVAVQQSAREADVSRVLKGNSAGDPSR